MFDPNFVMFVMMSAKGFPMLALVMAIVEYVKSIFGFTGKAVRIVSMVVGVVFGSLYMATQLNPVLYSVPLFILGILLYGLVIGLMASGFYDLTVNIGSKIVSVGATKFFDKSN